MIGSLDKQRLNPEWLRDFENLLNSQHNKIKSQLVKKVFIETYLENIRDGMNPKDAMQKAKMIALCFFGLQKW